MEGIPTGNGGESFPRDVRALKYWSEAKFGSYGRGVFSDAYLSAGTNNNHTAFIIEIKW